MRALSTNSLSVTLWLVVALAACNSDTRGDQVTQPRQGATEVGAPPPQTDPELQPSSMRAEARLVTAQGKEEGKATFVQEPDGVRIVLELKDVPPGKKGVHVHEKGDCSNIAAESMGPHFAPSTKTHALPSEADPRHLGDLGNIVVAADGSGRLEIKIASATLDPGAPTSFLGRSLIVHSGEDTGSAQQPSGGSGPPMACGVIDQS